MKMGLSQKYFEAAFFIKTFGDLGINLYFYI